jgi:hypothetical protein
MKEQHSPYRRLREQIDQHEFELPPSGWEQMADILDGKQPVPQPQPVEEDRKRRGIWWLFFAGLLLTGSLLGAQYWPSQPTAQGKIAQLSALPIPMKPNTDLYQEAPHTRPIAGREVSKDEVGEAAPPTTPPISTGQNHMVNAPVGKQPPRINVAPPAITPLSRLPKKQQTVQFASPLLRLPSPNTLLALPALPPTPLAEPQAELAAEPAAPVKKSGLHFGLKAGLDAQPRQTTGLIGLFARYRLSGRWALQLEPQYKLRSDNLGRGLALDASKEQTTFYPTVAQSSQRSVSITRLHFVELPLTALYQVHPKLQFLGGGQLVHIRNAFRSANYESRAAADLAYSAESSTEANRFPGILRWDAGLIIGVDYQLHPALSVDLRYVQGLYDLTNDAFFLEEDDYLNSSLQLSIKWKW